MTCLLARVEKKEVRITEVDLRVIQLDSTNRSVGLHADPEGHLVSCRHGFCSELCVYGVIGFLMDHPV